MIGAPAAPAAGRLSSSSGYLTDSSYNTSAENSLHELVVGSSSSMQLNSFIEDNAIQDILN